jgi:hypothetical protein
MSKFIFLIFASFIWIKGYCQHSTIKGKVESTNSKEKLSGAFVSCINKNGHQANAVTDNEGEFKFRDLPDGEYDLKIEYVGFMTYTTHLSVAQNRTEEIKIPLIQNGKSMAAVDVFGKISQEEDAGARQKEQRSNNIVNVISSKAMERSPDINAANVLQRMSGLTIQRNGGGDEAYAIIRGLDPRYSNTLIN